MAEDSSEQSQTHSRLRNLIPPDKLPQTPVQRSEMTPQDQGIRNAINDRKERLAILKESMKMDSTRDDIRLADQLEREILDLSKKLQ